MKRIQTGTKGPRGEAKVRVGNGKVQITFKEDQQQFTFPKSELPDSVKPGSFYVSLSGEGEFLSMRPLNAIVKAKFSNFVSQEGELPTPQEYKGGTARRRDGSTFSYDAYLAFIAVCKILDEEYRDMTVPVFLRYLFVDDGEGNIAIKGGGKNADMLESFLEATGIYDLEMKFSENVLPRLQKNIMKKSQAFQIMLKGGNADSFLELPGEDDDDDWNDGDGKPDEVILDDPDPDDDDSFNDDPEGGNIPF